MIKIIKPSNKQIEEKLKVIEGGIKLKKNFTRYDIQSALDLIAGYGYSVADKKNFLKELILRSGVKKIGIKTNWTPREDLEEEDKTLKFLDDILSYRGVIEE